MFIIYIHKQEGRKAQYRAPEALNLFGKDCSVENQSNTCTYGGTYEERLVVKLRQNPFF